MNPQRQDPEPPLPDFSDLGNQKEVEKTRGGWHWWWVYPVIAALVFWWAAWGWGNTGGYLWGFRSATHDNAANGAIENRAMTGGSGSVSGGIPNNNAHSNSPNAPAPATPSAVVTGGAPPSGPGVQVLDAANKQAFVGKSFHADNLPVERKVNDRALWVAAHAKAPMLVVIGGGENNNTSASNVEPGATVDATGTVKRAPNALEAKQKWNLSDDDAAQLEREGAYIQVSQLSVPQPRP